MLQIVRHIGYPTLIAVPYLLKRFVSGPGPDLATLVSGIVSLGMRYTISFWRMILVLDCTVVLVLLTLV